MFQYVFLAIYKSIFHMKHISVLHKYGCTVEQNRTNTCKKHTILGIPFCICKLCDTKQRPYKL